MERKKDDYPLGFKKSGGGKKAGCFEVGVRRACEASTADAVWSPRYVSSGC